VRLIRTDSATRCVRRLLAFVACLIAVAPGSAADSTPSGRAKLGAVFAPSGPPVKLPDVSWVPPLDEFDWIQLKSGEWLKGKLKGLQDRKLDFDSVELDELTFDWKDIRQVRTSRTVDFLSVNGLKLQGTVAITPTEVVVAAGGAPQTFPREQLLSVTPGGSKEWSYWSGNLSAGLTQSSGNSSQVDINIKARLERRTPQSRLTVDYLANYSRVEEVESVNNQRVNFEFNRRISPRTYLIVPSYEYYVDPLQNLAGRHTVAFGVGYDLLAKPTVEWNVSASPGYQKTIFESVEPGAETTQSAAAFVLSTRLDWNINRRLEWVSEYRAQLSKKDSGATTHHFVNTLSFDLTKRFELDVTLTWDRVQDPIANEEGVEPKKDDLRLVVGVGVNF
jgi:putative salt-induced outer membrane protein YdiY